MTHPSGSASTRLHLPRALRPKRRRRIWRREAGSGGGAAGARRRLGVVMRRQTRWRTRRPPHSSSPQRSREAVPAVAAGPVGGRSGCRPAASTDARVSPRRPSPRHASRKERLRSTDPCRPGDVSLSQQEICRTTN